jgi:hypothetical protein
MTSISSLDDWLAEERWLDSRDNRSDPILWLDSRSDLDELIELLPLVILAVVMLEVPSLLSIRLVDEEEGFLSILPNVFEASHCQIHLPCRHHRWCCWRWLSWWWPCRTGILVSTNWRMMYHDCGHYYIENPVSGAVVHGRNDEDFLVYTKYQTWQMWPTFWYWRMIPQSEEEELCHPHHPQH